MIDNIRISVKRTLFGVSIIKSGGFWLSVRPSD